MKKFILILISCLLVSLPVFATNWVKVTEKRYLDTSSVRPLKDSYSTIYSTNSNKYTFWIKSLNDGSVFFQVEEKTSGEKVWYALSQWGIDCNNASSALIRVITYGLSNNVLYSHQIPDLMLEWNNIAPETMMDLFYNCICRPNNGY